MTWEKVASAQVSSQGVLGDIWQAVAEIPKGTQGRIIIEAPGIAPFMDAAGVEAIIQATFNAKGVDATVIDCYGEGWNTGYINFQGSPFAIISLLWAIAAVLAAIGFVMVVATISLYVVKPAAEAITAIPGGWFTIVAGGMVLGGVYLWSKVKS